jgi:hypothetical protein
LEFNQRFEGVMSTMYLDTHSPPLVTIGVGNLIDPVSEALKLPFLRKHSDPPRSATVAEISSEWNLIKSLTRLSNSKASMWDAVTNLYLALETIHDLVLSRLDANEEVLRRRAPFVSFESWPADAQLGLLSMAWAMGPGFNFPKFAVACEKRDFLTASEQCVMNERNNPGLAPRNRANVQLFRNAAKALTPSVLYYPQAL